MLFLLLDKVDENNDVALARHVATVHKTLKAPARDDTTVVSAEVMRGFIVKAQEFEPVIPQELHNYIVAKYVEKRKLQREGLDEQSYMYVTPRTLLAIIRLSQSLAKLSFRAQVNQSDVDESIKLMDFSIRSLRTLKANEAGKPNKLHHDTQGKKEDRMTEVVRAVRHVISQSNLPHMRIPEIIKAIQKNHMIGIGALDRDELMGILNHYKKLSIIYIDQDENVIFL